LLRTRIKAAIQQNNSKLKALGDVIHEAELYKGLDRIFCKRNLPSPKGTKARHPGRETFKKILDLGQVQGW
jgi:hypothetical protein